MSRQQASYLEKKLKVFSQGSIDPADFSTGYASLMLILFLEILSNKLYGPNTSKSRRLKQFLLEKFRLHCLNMKSGRQNSFDILRFPLRISNRILCWFCSSCCVCDIFLFGSTSVSVSECSTMCSTRSVMIYVGFFQLQLLRWYFILSCYVNGNYDVLKWKSESAKVTIPLFSFIKAYFCGSYSYIKK